MTWVVTSQRVISPQEQSLTIADNRCGSAARERAARSRKGRMVAATETVMSPQSPRSIILCGTLVNFKPPCVLSLWSGACVPADRDQTQGQQWNSRPFCGGMVVRASTGVATLTDFFHRAT